MLDELLGSMKGELLEKLHGQSGIESGEAEGFFDRAVEMIQGVIGGGDFDIAELLQGNFGGLLEKLDLGALTGMISGGEADVRGGIEAMLSGVTEKVGVDDAGDLLSKLTDGRGLGGMMGKMFGQ